MKKPSRPRIAYRLPSGEIVRVRHEAWDILKESILVGLLSGETVTAVLAKPSLVGTYADPKNA